MSWFTHWLLPHESNNQRAKLLHPSSLAIVVILFAIFQVGIGQVARNYPQVLGYASQIAPSEIIRLTNVEREKQGLADVSLDPELSAAAAQKAADMFARDYWAHVSPIGTQPWYWITQSGYDYRYAGENLARDFSDPNSVVQAWMNSPSHRENLLSDKYHDIGVAVVDGKLGGQDTTLVVQMFGTRLSYTGPNITKSALDISVKAAGEPIPTSIPSLLITPMPTPTTVVLKTSPFSVTKALSLVVLVVIIGVLTVDVILVARRKIVRWTSRSVAHLAFMIFLLISAIIIYRGQIM